MPAGVASDTSESVGQDAASLVRSEVSLDPGRHAPASGVFVPGRGEKGLEVVLDDGVERSRRGATRCGHLPSLPAGLGRGMGSWDAGRAMAPRTAAEGPQLQVFLGARLTRVCS